MTDKAIEKGRTERYLPKEAWAKLTAEERRETDEKKKQQVNKVNSLFLILNAQRKHVKQLVKQNNKR